jgi:hypothetical protein
MIRRVLGRRAPEVDSDADLVAEGFGDLVTELRDHAAGAPAPAPSLEGRVLLALAREPRDPRPTVAAPGLASVRRRLTYGLRPVSFRSVLAAAALVAVLGAGAVLAAGGRLPFNVPTFGAPAATEPTAPVRGLQTHGPSHADGPATEHPDEDRGDGDTAPDASDDADHDRNEDAGDDDSDDHDGADDDSNSDDEADDDSDDRADEDSGSDDEADDDSESGDDEADDDSDHEDATDSGDDEADDVTGEDDGSDSSTNDSSSYGE